MKPVSYMLILCLSVIILNSSCVSSASIAKKITIESGEIPPDMAKEDFYLIGVLKGRDSYDKYLEKGFSEYHGKYVLATLSEIEKKYKDTSKYRYILDYVLDNKSMTYMSERSPDGKTTRNSTSYTYYIRDRKTDKKYIRSAGSSFFSMEIRTYLNAIENIRVK